VKNIPALGIFTAALKIVVFKKRKNNSHILFCLCFQTNEPEINRVDSFTTNNWK
jgi:hypothetical protein